MSTSNPKVSAYIPQHIYDSFKSFYEQRGISMSQAVAVIFAEYFGLDSSVDQKSSTSGLLVGRVGLLEQELADLKELVQKHLQSSSAVQEKEHLVVCDGGSPEAVSLDVAEPTSITPSEPPKEGGLLEAELPEVLENMEASLAEGDLPENTPSESVGGVSGELLRDSDLSETESVEGEPPEVVEKEEAPLVADDSPELALSELASNLPSELLNKDESLEKVKPESGTAQESLDRPDGLLFPIPGKSPRGIQPIPGKNLSKRLKTSASTLSTTKKNKNTQSFANWTRVRDPNNIGWRSVNTPAPGYLPADELPNDIHSKLLEWIKNEGL